MRSYALVSATLAPVALVGGWTVSAARQPASYDATSDTISALAALGATDRWIMTLGLAVLGICHIVTAVGLDDARTWGRLLLGLGGTAALLVAAFPEPAAGHVPAATLSFVALAVWPAAAGVPTRAIGWAAAVVLSVLLVWFGLELGTGRTGLAERVVAGAQACWPLATVLLGAQGRNSVAGRASGHDR